jgi:hypothetical protein
MSTADEFPTIDDLKRHEQEHFASAAEVEAGK